MAFLLTSHNHPALFRSVAGESRRPFQAKHAEKHGSFSLFVGGFTLFAKLEQDPLAPASRGPLWVVLDGTLPKKLDRAQPDQIAKALKLEGNLRPLDDLGANHVLLLAAPARRWVFFQRGLIGARSAFQARAGEIFALASQARLIAELPGFSRRSDSAFMASMFGLQLIPPKGHTPFAAIKELNPGETIQGRASDLRSTHQRLESFPADRVRTTEQWVKEYRACFEQAVIDALSKSASPGVMLSGGLDSGPVAAIAARNLAQTGKRISTVSWRLPAFPEADEWQYISKVGKSINARMHSLIADKLLPFSEVAVTVETPVFNAFDPLLRACYELARQQGIDTILTGGAGDRIYPDPSWTMYDNLREHEFRLFLKALLRSIGRPSAGKMMRYPPLRYLVRRLIKGKRPGQVRPAHWLTSHASLSFNGSVEWPDEVREHAHPEYANRLTSNWLAGHSAAETVTAEGFGLSRVDPFLNQDLIELMLSMPFSLTFRENQAKWQMRQAMKLGEALPQSIIEKPRTGLLGSFFDAGFAQARPWIADVLLRQDSSWQEWVKAEFVKTALSTPEATSQQKLVAARCLGYCLWRKEVERLPGAQ